MPGETVSVGPFNGGLNTQSDEGAIDDHELVICQNFEVESDGSLRSRPPLVNRGATALPTGWRMLGYFTNTTTGVTYPIGSAPSTGTFYLAGTTWTLITTTCATAVVQFNGNLYLVAATGDTNNGGVWNGTTFTADATMPKGLSIVAYKSRLWVSDATQVRFSAVTPGANFWTVGGTYGGSFQVSGGDGQRNVKLMLGYGNLLIFRSSSIWQFSFSNDPTFGSQSQLVAGVGLDSSDAVEMFENIVYFIYLGQAYTLNGANTARLNSNVPFISNSRVGNYSPFSVSVVGRKVIFSYYDVMYVFNLRSRTWTTWTTPAYKGVGKFLTYSTAVTSDNMTYVTNSSYSSGGVSPTLFFTDAYTTELESPAYPCVVQTKTFDYATPDHFKRLFWWGADMVARAPVTGTLKPIVATAAVTWGQVRTMTWGQLLGRTWSSPLTPSYDVPIVATARVGSSRTFFRFPRSLRFRRIRYQISLSSDGSSSTAPNKLFALETVVTVKQLVPRRVS